MYDNYFNDSHPLKPWTNSVPADPRSSVPATNAMRGERPIATPGNWPCWNGKKWVQVEDHRGKSGYIGGDPITITALGPLPTGWSDTPPEPTLDEARAAKRAEVLSACQAAFAPAEAEYPAAEREGWPAQEAEARALQNDPTTETPLLSLLAQERGQGETPAELAAKVLAKAEHRRILYARLTGRRRRMCAEIAALDSPEAVRNYTVDFPSA